MRLAELKVERMVFEATVQKEEAEIEAHKAKLSHQQAMEKLASQKIVNAAEVKKRQLNIERQERDLQKARDDLASTTIKAEKPGLVVYGKVWKGERPEKIRVGDEIWGGVNVISLPDLSHMQVKTYVNEVEVDKLDTGQVATIKLDALPAPTFHGKNREHRLARPRERRRKKRQGLRRDHPDRRRRRSPQTRHDCHLSRRRRDHPAEAGGPSRLRTKRGHRRSRDRRTHAPLHPPRRGL